MKGEDLVKILSDEFSVKIEPMTKSQWRKKKHITPTILRNVQKKLRHQVLDHAIAPIVEFHYLDFDHQSNVDSFASRLNDKKILKQLKERKGGIYAFFDTTGEIIYVGKTSGVLFTEMEQRYKGKQISFRTLAKGKAKRLSRPIEDVAQFVSAYRIDEPLITNVEALLTRIIINKASNIRTESFKTTTTHNN
jgi:hypothetical protein